MADINLQCGMAKQHYVLCYDKRTVNFELQIKLHSLATLNISARLTAKTQKQTFLLTVKKK